MAFFSKIFQNNKSKNIKKLPDAIAFVDYEHWFISYETKYRALPDLQGWFTSLREKCNLTEVIFFANFSKFDNKEEEVKKIRAFTNKIIDTFNPDPVSEKDYTDFIILDNIYQSAMKNSKIDMYILFTGDGHFNSVTAFLKNICRKEVGIYGVKGCINSNLFSSASWVEEVSFEQKSTEFVYNCIFSNLYKLREKSEIIPTFGKTVQIVSSQNNLPDYVVKNALSELIKDGYIHQEHQMIPSGNSGSAKNEIRALIVDWKKASKDKLWFSKKK